jgi:hypothetical protein
MLPFAAALNSCKRFLNLYTVPRMSFTKLQVLLRRVLGFVLLCTLYTCAMVLIITAIRVSDNVPAGETAINFRYEVF